MYPFDLPDGSYLFRDGRIEPIRAVGSARIPVLALGANGAPSQLARKFPGRGATIPVTRAMLHDHVVVYSAHFASYGALPATLARHPGSIAWVFVTWLDEAQLHRMHASEGVGASYDLVRLPDAAVDDELVGRLGEVAGYVSRAGALLHGCQPIRVAEIPTIGCALPALTQRAALRWVQRRLAPFLDHLAFLRRIAEDASFRRATNVALRELAGPATERSAPAVA
jgi:hypothetical protein